jgi:hypothetical protein
LLAKNLRTLSTGGPAQKDRGERVCQAGEPAIGRLERARIVKRVGDAMRERVYCATALLDNLEEPARLPPHSTDSGNHSLDDRQSDDIVISSLDRSQSCSVAQHCMLPPVLFGRFPDGQVDADGVVQYEACRLVLHREIGAESGRRNHAALHAPRSAAVLSWAHLASIASKGSQLTASDFPAYRM